MLMPRLMNRGHRRLQTLLSDKPRERLARLEIADARSPAAHGALPAAVTTLAAA